MSFRIAIGQCSCARPYKDEIQEWACTWIEAHLVEWRSRLPGDLRSFPEEAFDHQIVDGHHVSLGMYRHSFEDGTVAVVLQVFVHTWRRPTFFAFGRVGRIYAEGLLIAPGGDVQRAPDETMWNFR